MSGSEGTAAGDGELNSLAEDVAQDIVGNFVMAPDADAAKVSAEFQILLSQNKVDAALSLLINSPKTNLQHPMITFQLGYVLSLKNRLIEAQTYLEKTLENLFHEYEDSIKNVDFRLDTAKVKADIQARTRHFLKKRK